jgi:hypothetical protein
MTKLLKWIYQLGYDQGYAAGYRDGRQAVADMEAFKRKLDKLGQGIKS